MRSAPPELHVLPPTPEACLRRLAAGELQALGPLFDAIGNRVYAVVMRVLRSEPDAEETVSDVFQQVWRTAPRWDPERGTAEAWILQMAWSRAVDRLRRRRARPDESMPAHPDALHAAYTDAVDPAADLLSSLESRSAVRAAFEALGEEQRRCIALAFLEGLSHAEVAARLGMPLGTVKSHVRRGLGAMRKLLETRGHDGP